MQKKKVLKKKTRMSIIKKLLTTFKELSKEKIQKSGRKRTQGE